jgi:hypothetical protein
MFRSPSSLSPRAILRRRWSAPAVLSLALIAIAANLAVGHFRPSRPISCRRCRCRSSSSFAAALGFMLRHANGLRSSAKLCTDAFRASCASS